MRRNTAWSTRSRLALALLANALLISLLVPGGPASAAITSASAAELEAAMTSDPDLVTGASFVEVPGTGTPNGVGDAPLASFPRADDTFAILTTGDANLADDPNTLGSSGADLGTTDPIRGGARDATILKLPVTVPDGANCITIEFRFLSEEFPEFVGQAFNDAFVAELDTNDWSIGTGGVVTAPSNFAFGPDGAPISINTTGATAMSAAEATGTTYDGATPLLTANAPVEPGVHHVYLSIFDQGDNVYDSAVFVDALSAGTVTEEVGCLPGANPAISQVALSADPAVTPPGIDDASLDGLPADKIDQSASATDSAPIGRAPIGRAPIGRAPIGRAPIGRAPIGRAPIGRAPIGRAPIGRAPIGRAPLAVFALNLPGGWSSVLDHTANFAGAPAVDVTLFELFNDPYATDGNAGTLSELAPECAGSPPPTGCLASAISLADLNLIGSPLGDVPLLAFLMGDLTWNSVEAPATGWCAEWDAVSPIPCDPSRTIFDTAAEGFPLDSTSLPLRTLGQLTGDPARSRAVLWSLSIPDLNIDGTALGDITLGAIATGGEVNKVVVCSMIGIDCAVDSTQSLRQANTLGAIRVGAGSGVVADLGAAANDLTLSDVVTAVLDPSSLPWENLPLAEAGFEHMPEDNPTNFVTYSLRFSVGCENVAGLQVGVGLPPGFAYRPGSSSATATNYAAIAPPGEPDHVDGTESWGLVVTGCPTGEATRVTLLFDVRPGFETGAFGSDVTISTDTLEPVEVLNIGPIQVADFLEDARFGGDDVGSASPSAVSEHMYVGYVEGPTDVDLWDLVPDLEGGTLAGKRIEVTLSHLSRDYDLVLYAPDGSSTDSLLRAPVTVVDVSAGAPIPDPGLTGVLPPPALEGIHLDPSKVVAGISSFRDTEPESIATTAVAGGSGGYLIQVTGHNGAYGPEPYVLIVRIFDEYDIPNACQSLTAPDTAAPSAALTAAPTSPSDKTIYLVNAEALSERYGTTEASEILAELELLAGTPGEAQGAVVQVDADPNARDALQAYYADPCNVAGANAAVREVNDAVDSLGPAYLEHIENVVIVGDDSLLPHAAIPDNTGDGNENGFTGDTIFSVGGTATSNHLTAAFGGNFFLSDAPYAAFHPLRMLGQVVYVPQAAHGRLGGDGATILSQLEAFRASVGVADPDSASGVRRALVTDYDFMSDMGSRIAAELDAAAWTVARLTGGSWTAADFLASFLNADDVPDVVAQNGHHDQYRMLPAAGNTTGDQSDLVTTADVSALGSSALLARIIFSIGCHFALGIPDEVAGASSGTNAARLLDWPQAYAQKGTAAVVGKLGFGFGDTATMAYDELIMAGFAANLDGSMTVGEALLGAERDYFSSLATFNPYAIKVVQDTVLWGLPMYTVAGSGIGASASSPLTAIAVSPPTDTDGDGLFTTEVSLSGLGFNKNTLPSGKEFYDVDGVTEAVHPYPIMPKVVTDLPSAEGLVVHGAVPTALTEAEEPIDIAFANATIDSSAEGAPPAEVVYPIGSAIGSVVDAGGNVQQTLVVTPGEFASDANPDNSPSVGTFGKFTASTWEVVYSSNTTDFVPPAIGEVSVTPSVTPGSVDISARVTDAAMIDRVFALVETTGTGTYVLVELSNGGSGTLWSATAAIDASSVKGVSVYAIDGNGNTAAAHDKTVGFDVQPADTTRPSVTVLTPPQGAIYDLNEVVPESYNCTDEVGGSGVEPGSPSDSNGGDELDTSTTGAHQITVTCSDNDGNVRTVTRTYFVQYQGFTGLFAPVDNQPTVNQAKAGQGVPLRWRIVDANGVPLADPNFASVTVKTYNGCAGNVDPIEVYSSGSSGVQYLGDGNWQFNWKTEKAWAGSCREVILNLKDGTGTRPYVSALFRFK